ncbi:hypothetical protein [uncultured Campylobacter sp.]|uniref:hypothetical protein n=1 Tax=uncultured Campylobacter sp. TaxID=218934 RepID=UPI00261F4CAC|nr:hypothetical protein [uncultured Campylobacter sp.]
MNAKYDKTFVIGSAFIIDIKYYDADRKLLAFPAKYTSVDMVFTNVGNDKKLVLNGVGSVNGGRVRIEVSANAWDKAESGFFRNDVSDIFGCGGKWHNYSVWLKSSVSNDELNILRGAAKLVRGK